MSHQYILLAAIGVLLIFGWHTKVQLDKVPVLQAQLQQYKTAYAQEVDAFTKSEDLRFQEQQKARGAVAALDQTCEVRINEARRSSAAIKDLLNVVPPPQGGCPVRAMLDAHKLRDALGAAAH